MQSGRLWLRVLYNGEELRTSGSRYNEDGLLLIEYDAFKKRLEPLRISAIEYVKECQSETLSK